VTSVPLEKNTVRSLENFSTGLRGSLSVFSRLNKGLRNPKALKLCDISSQVFFIISIENRPYNHLLASIQ
jgi:hypothetical protein